MEKLFEEKQAEIGSLTLQTEIVLQENGACSQKGVKDELMVQKTTNGYIVKRVFQNCSGQEIHLKELKATIKGICVGKERKKDYFYCNENPRIYGNFTLPVDFDRTNGVTEQDGIKLDVRFADPDTVGERICASPYQPFPAILISNYDSLLGLVHGSLSQDAFFHNYTVCHDENGVVLNVYSSFKGIAYRIVKPNEILVDEWYVGVTERANDINFVFKEYVDELRKVLTWEKRSANRKTLVWDSWNDGVYRDVSEELLIAEGKALKELFPSVEWLQLDDGYSAYCHENVDLDAHGLGVVYEGEEGIDYQKFPNGLKGYTDKVKELGLKPAIWVGGFCPVKTKIFREKPEWFIEYTYRVDWTQPLDVSIPEVREYMLSALDKFFVEYGFEGVKHDFWSYAFEDSHDILKNKDKSAYEHRRWWLTEMRKRLPPYGYMEACCDLGLGNPFLGEFFDNYRYGLDVGDGNWEKVKTTMFWGVACMATHTGDLYIPNGDSIGLMRGLSERDFLFLVNYLTATGSMVEFAGLYSKADCDEERKQFLQKATEHIRNGIDAFYIQFDYRRTGRVLPEIIYNTAEQLDFVKDAGVVGRIFLFNAEETEKEIVLTLSALGLKEGEYKLVDIWTGKTVVCTGEYKTIFPVHGSRAFYIERVKK